jgi:tRNA dimethylallyltransferase
MNRAKLIIIQGPTASGKSDLGIFLAIKFGGEIINADSMQVVRHLNIGTAKPSEEEKQGIPHHLIDIVDPADSYTAGDFARDAACAIEEIGKRNKVPIVVGGTNFYIDALTLGLCDMPTASSQIQKIRQKMQVLRSRYSNEYFYRWANMVDGQAMRAINVNDFYRISRVLEVFYGTGQRLSEFHRQQHQERAVSRFLKYQTLKLGLSVSREILYERINRRVVEMVSKGWTEETIRILQRGYSAHLRSLQTLGYKWMIRHVQGAITLEEAIHLTQRDTRHFSKRQLTWLRKQKDIHWIDYQTGRELALEKARQFLIGH